MDLETVSAEEFGRSLTGLGINLLAIDVTGLASFLTDVFDMNAHRLSQDFAIVDYCGHLFQIHADHTYRSHPLPSLLPESGARGGGLEVRLYETDPDQAVAKARMHTHRSTLLQAPANKPHGLRECVILCENGYAWVPSRRLSDTEVAEV